MSLSVSLSPAVSSDRSALSRTRGPVIGTAVSARVLQLQIVDRHAERLGKFASVTGDHVLDGVHPRPA